MPFAVVAAVVIAVVLGAGDAAAEEALPNGLRTWEFLSGDPATFSIAIIVGTGARDEPEEQRGISHALEHAIFLGTQDLDRAQLLDEFRHRGVEFNGSTSSDLTTFHFDAPAEQAEWLIGVTAAMIARPPLREKDVTAEIQIVLEELDGRGADIAAPGIETELYPRHGLGSNPGGSSSTVRALDAAQLAAWHSQRYRATDMAVAWADDPARHDALAAAMRSAYGAIPPGSAQGARIAPDPRVGSILAPDMLLSAATASAHPGMLVSGHHVRDASPETFAAMLVMERLLADECFRSMRTERQLAYFTQVAFEVRTDARRLEFEGQVRDAGKLSDLVDALRIALARAPLVDEATFDAARMAALDDISMPSSGRALERVASLEFMLARQQGPGPHLERALAELTRERMARIVAAELMEANAFVVSNTLIVGPLAPGLKKAGLVLAIIAGVLLLLAMSRRPLRRLRLRILDATTRLRMDPGSNEEREQVAAEIEKFLRRPTRRRDPTDKRDPHES